METSTHGPSHYKIRAQSTYCQSVCICARCSSLERKATWHVLQVKGCVACTCGCEGACVAIVKGLGNVGGLGGVVVLLREAGRGRDEYNCLVGLSDFLADPGRWASPLIYVRISHQLPPIRGVTRGQRSGYFSCCPSESLRKPGEYW